MNRQRHLEPDQLKSLLFNVSEGDQAQELSEHLADCPQCQQALDSMAAHSGLWEKAPQLMVDSTLGAGSPVGDLGYQVESLLDTPSHPEMMGRIGPYDIEREVGRGGMGVVLKAYDAELNRPLAIKVLSPRLAENGTARQRFDREARAAAAVIHPNVIAIHGVNANEKTPYLVMPFIAGPSLQRLIELRGPLEEKDIVRIALQIASALDAAHSQGLVHRDIKPANILVEPDVSRVLVTDFGLARAIDDASATQSGYFVGTPNYMSPEQSLGRPVDGRSDLFSLGSLIYFMASGHMPFRADSSLGVLNRITNDEPVPLHQINSDISNTICNVVRKLIAKDPSQRFQTAGELHEVLEQHLAHLHLPNVHRTPSVKPPRLSTTSNAWTTFASVKRLPVIVAALLLASLGYAFGLFSISGSADPDASRLASMESDWRATTETAFPDDPGFSVFDTNHRRQFPAKPGSKLVMDVERGDITVFTGDVSQIQVDVQQSVSAADQQEADRLVANHLLSFRPSEVGLELKATMDPQFKRQGGPKRFRNVRFVLTVPERTDLKIATKQGDITSADITGKVNLVTKRGHLTLANLNGSAYASTDGGDIRVGDVMGDLMVDTLDGRIQLGHVRGNATVKSMRGNVSAKSIDGSVNAITMAGSVEITIEKQPKKNCWLETTAGDIRVHLAKDIAMDVEANTTVGNITAPFQKPSRWQKPSLLNVGSSLKTELRGGGPSLTATTNTGNVHFTFLPDPKWEEKADPSSRKW